MRVSVWNGCYNNQWTELIVSKAFSHPAKFSPGLIQKIYAHCIERGYLNKGGFCQVDEPLYNKVLDEINSGEYNTYVFKFAGGDKKCNLKEKLKQENVEEKKQNLKKDKIPPTNSQSEQLQLDNIDTTIHEHGLKSLNQTHGLEELLMYGCNMAEPYQMDSFCTISTKTQQTTTSKTSCLSTDPDTHKCTVKNTETEPLDTSQNYKTKILNVINAGTSFGANIKGKIPFAKIVELFQGDCIRIITKSGYVLKKEIEIGDRIYKQPDLISDCFGGIGGGAIFAAYAGLRHISVELEPKFVDLAEQNFSLHRANWKAHGYPEPVIIQGDSRRFSEIVGEVSGIVTSPPYSEIQGGGGIGKSVRGKSDYKITSPGVIRTKRAGRSSIGFGYQDQGDTSGQIGALKSGDLSAIVTSPPYAEGIGHESKPSKIDIQKKLHIAAGASSYGKTEGQIGKLKTGNLDAVCTSPPYADSLQSEKHGIDLTKIKPDYPNRKLHNKRLDMLNRHHIERRYSPDPANIGNLKVDSIVTSPPWEDREGSHSAKKYKDPEKVAETMSQNYRNGKFSGHYASKEAIIKGLERENNSEYGNSDGQIGKEKSESYWQAMRTVYSECHKALKPQGYLIVVVKAYVKNKKRVPLPMQTIKLLIHLGFEPVERIKAMLVQESTNKGLFGDDIVRKTERKSFFRRLAENRGSPRIDFEEVLICRKLKEE